MRVIKVGDKVSVDVIDLTSSDAVSQEGVVARLESGFIEIRDEELVGSWIYPWHRVDSVMMLDAEQEN